MHLFGNLLNIVLLIVALPHFKRDFFSRPKLYTRVEIMCTGLKACSENVIPFCIFPVGFGKDNESIKRSVLIIFRIEFSIKKSKISLIGFEDLSRCSVNFFVNRSYHPKSRMSCYRMMCQLVKKEKCTVFIL